MTAADLKAVDSSADVKQIIDEVFSISGQKISADDPIIAVLLYQKRQLTINHAALVQHETDFFINLDQRFQKINTYYDEIQKQKNIILTELMQKNKTMVREELQNQKPKHETTFFVVLGILLFTQLLLIILTVFK